MKNVKALDVNVECFKHFVEKLPGRLTPKVKARIFDGPQLHQLVSDTNMIRH